MEENRDHGPLGFQFGRLSHQIVSEINRKMLDHGIDQITAMHSWILGYLNDHTDLAVYQRDLEALNRSKSSITNALQVLEKGGYITRTEDPRDSRKKRVELTERGREAHREAMRCIDEVENQLIRGFDGQELEQLQFMLDRMYENSKAGDAMEPSDGNRH